MRKLADGRYEVDATLTLDLLNDRLGLQLPTDGEFQTIGGLVFHELGACPERAIESRFMESNSRSSTSPIIQFAGS